MLFSPLMLTHSEYTITKNLCEKKINQEEKQRGEGK